MAEEFDPNAIEENLARAQKMAKKQSKKRTLIITGGIVFLCIVLVGTLAGIYSVIISSQPAISQPSAAPETPLLPANLYDSFDAPAGVAFDSSLWQFWGDNPAEYLNENGALSQTTSSAGAGMIATRYIQYKPAQPFVYEVKMMLDDQFHAGAADMKIHIDLADGGWWVSECFIGALETDTQGYASCSSGSNTGEFIFQSEGMGVPFGTWHTFRIEFVPESMTFDYYLDGILLATQVPGNAEALKNGSFSFVIGTHSVSPKVKVYFDDVIIGPK